MAERTDIRGRVEATVIYDDGDGSQGGNGGNDSESNSVKGVNSGKSNSGRNLSLGIVALYVIEVVFFFSVSPNEFFSFACLLFFLWFVFTVIWSESDNNKYRLVTGLMLCIYPIPLIINMCASTPQGGPFTLHNDVLALGYTLGGTGIVGIESVALVLPVLAVVYVITAVVRSAWKK
jgi:hypothetical protein